MSGSVLIRPQQWYTSYLKRIAMCMHNIALYNLVTLFLFLLFLFLLFLSVDTIFHLSLSLCILLFMHLQTMSQVVHILSTRLCEYSSVFLCQRFAPQGFMLLEKSCVYDKFNYYLVTIQNTELSVRKLSDVLFRRTSPATVD